MTNKTWSTSGTGHDFESDFFIAKYVSRQVLQQNRVADKSVDLKGYAFEFFPADAFITFGDNPIQILIRVSEICMCGL